VSLESRRVVTMSPIAGSDTAPTMFARERISATTAGGTAARSKLTKGRWSDGQQHRRDDHRHQPDRSHGGDQRRGGERRDDHGGDGPAWLARLVMNGL
jgi:hypothetical protein